MVLLLLCMKLANNPNRVAPRAAVRARPLQYIEMPTICRLRARYRVPQAFVHARPLKRVEVSAQRRVFAHLRLIKTTFPEFVLKRT